MRGRWLLSNQRNPGRYWFGQALNEKGAWSCILTFFPEIQELTPIMTVSRFEADLGLRAVVMWVKAGVVHRPIDRKPVCMINASRIAARRAFRKCGDNFDPAILLAGDDADLVCYFRKVLVLAEDNGDIIFFPIGHTHDIDCYADIDSFFFAKNERVLLAVW